MGLFKGVAAGCAAVSMLCAVPASAAGYTSAEKLRRLDIMLMVTGLRCRNTADNFQSDYGRFTTSHYKELQAAASTMRTQLSGRYGSAGADKALDRLSVSMANSYGNGHPWLDCAQLKQVTRSLIKVRGEAPLIAAADQLLEDRGTPQFAWAR